MKKIIATLTVLLLITISAFSRTTISPIPGELSIGKDPVVIEVIAKDTTIEAALINAKNALMKSKFIATAGIQSTTFTATRTTGSHADYYVADVSASKADGKVKLTINFIKVGTGLKSLQKMADEVKAELEK